MTKRLLLGILLNAAALYAVVYFLPEVQYSGGWKFFLIGGAFMGMLNTLVKPFLKILALPFIFLSAGLFIILINAFIFWLLEYLLVVLQFQDVKLAIPGFTSYILAALIFGVVNFVIHLFIKNNDTN